MPFKAGKYNSSIRLVFQSKALIAQTKALIGKNATMFPQKVPLACKHLQAENTERHSLVNNLNIK